MSTLITKGERRCLGFAELAAIAASTGLPSLPTGTRLALIKVENQAIRYRSDGGTPTASSGIPVAVGETLNFDGDWASMQAFRFIQQAASAKVSIEYYE